MKQCAKAGLVAVLLLTVAWSSVWASDPFDPCGLITKQELEVLVGEPVKKPELRDTKNPLGQKMCLYSTVSDSRLIEISVIRTADMSPKVVKNGQSASAIYRATKDMLDPSEAVTGIGDDACWGTPGLHILKDDVYVLIAVGNTSKRENRELARQIAEKVLPRL